MTLDATGLTVPRLADLRATARAAIAGSSVLGPTWQTGTGSVLGQIIDALLTRVASAYELLAQVYQAFDPDSAEGTQLDYLCAIIGIVREPAGYCYGDITITGVATTAIPAGTLFRVPDGAIVAAAEDAIIEPGGTVDVSSLAEEIGVVDIAALTITEIVTPLVGMLSVTNALDWTPGRARETDAELRARRERVLVAPSASTDYGIGSALEALTSVTYARAISDRVLHTVRCVVYPNTADSDDVAATVWDNVPAGITMVGAQSAVVTDEAGVSQTVYWDWVTEQTIVIVCNISGIDNTPTNVAAVKDSILAELGRLSVGDDVYAIQLIGAVVEDMGDGVTACTLTVDGGASVAIDDDELAVSTAVSITVNIT